MVQAALAKAQGLNVTISVAVCDTGGNLVALNRMDGASAVSATVAQGTAAAAAGFGRASRTLQVGSPVIQAVIAALGGRMLPARGAVPVVKSAERIGSDRCHRRAGRAMCPGGGSDSLNPCAMGP